MKAIQKLAAFLICASFGSVAQATVVDMESLPSGACHYIGSSVTTQGYSFSASQILFSCDGNVLSQDPTRGIIDANGPSKITMTSESGVAFNLKSFDAGSRTLAYNVTRPNDYQGSSTVTVTGNKVGGGTVTNVFNFNGLAYQNFSVVGFSNLSSVIFSGSGYSMNPEFILDNVNVSAVPEPESYAMLLAGLGLMGYMVRRRKAA